MNAPLAAEEVSHLRGLRLGAVDALFRDDKRTTFEGGADGDRETEREMLARAQVSS